MDALASDYRCWDATTAVTLEAPARQGEAPGRYYLAVAKQRAVRGRERSPSGGVYLGHETRWHLPYVLLPEGVLPVPGWVVEEEDGTRWTVLTRDRNRRGQTCTLGCVDLVLAHDLRDTVVIERATISHDASGAAVKDDWRPLYTVRARVQLQEESPDEARGARYGRRRYQVIVDRQLPLLDVAEDRLRWQPDTRTAYLDLMAYRQPERIDELPVLEAEERR